eukprot:TRINITY_DN29307_c0_g1_i1.p1 TRINITY_DN29307_c0_g1~~TRINITY_DN29307_c0_g1_i1.p1  ORF type:complete len:1616 (+),score=130.67 TRINITY_DN29307_c0_g1_i1:70-4917(+)
MLAFVVIVALVAIPLDSAFAPQAEELEENGYERGDATVRFGRKVLESAGERRGSSASNESLKDEEGHHHHHQEAQEEDPIIYRERKLEALEAAIKDGSTAATPADILQCMHYKVGRRKKGRQKGLNFSISNTCLRRVDALAYRNRCAASHCPDVGEVFSNSRGIAVSWTAPIRMPIERYNKKRRPKCLYERDDSKFIIGPFVQRPRCNGVGGCQFKTLTQAQKFCDDVAECSAITLSPLGSNCEKGFGCYRAVSGSAKDPAIEDSRWKEADGRTWVKKKCPMEYENVCANPDVRTLTWKKFPRLTNEGEFENACADDPRCAGFILTSKAMLIRMGSKKAKWAKVDIRYAWGEMPTGQYSENKGCPSGYQEITRSAICDEAYRSLTSRSSVMKKLVRSVNMLWNNRPSGCWWHTRNRNVHFNYQNTCGQRLQGDDRVICELTAPAKRAAFLIGKAPPAGAQRGSCSLCPRGYDRVANEGSCLSALKYLGPGPLKGVRIAEAGFWRDRPAGCLWHSANKSASFNKVPLSNWVSKFEGGAVVICKKAPYSSPSQKARSLPSLFALRSTQRVCTTVERGIQERPSLLAVNLAVKFPPKAATKIVQQRDVRTLSKCKMRCVTTHRCSVMAWTRTGVCNLRLSNDQGEPTACHNDRTYVLGSTPRGTYVRNMGCPKGYNTVVDVASCDHAFDVLRRSSKLLASVQRGPTGVYKNQPFGCFVQKESHVVFNLRNTIGKTLEGKSRAICEYAAKGQRPDFVLAGAPTGKYEKDKGCPEGFTSISNATSCTAATNYLKQYGSLGGLVRNADVSLLDRPLGCWWHASTSFVHFNSRTTVSRPLLGHDAVICARDDVSEQTCKSERKIPIRCLREVRTKMKPFPSRSENTVSLINLCADTSVMAKWVTRPTRVSSSTALLTCRLLGGMCLGLAFNKGTARFRIAEDEHRLFATDIMFKVGVSPRNVYDINEGCPRGFKTIADVGTCDAALAQLVGVHRGEDNIWRNRPAGCFIGADKSLRFNMHGRNKGHILEGNDRVVCEFHAPAAGPKFVLGTAPSYLFTEDLGCPSGYSAIKTPSMCAKAYVVLRQRIKILRLARRGQVSRYKDRPPGCSISINARRVVFNTQQSLGMRMRGQDAVICVQASFGTRPAAIRTGDDGDNMDSRCLRGLEAQARFPTTTTEHSKGSRFQQAPVQSKSESGRRLSANGQNRRRAANEVRGENGGKGKGNRGKHVSTGVDSASLVPILNPSMTNKNAGNPNASTPRETIPGVTFENICVDNSYTGKENVSHLSRSPIEYRDALGQCLGTYRCSGVSCQGTMCALRLVPIGKGRKRKTSIMYKLEPYLPGGQRRGGPCSPGYTRIDDVRTCDHAFETMMDAELNGTLRAEDRVWKNHPAGCFLNTATKTVLFNYAASSNVANEGTRLICQWDRPPPRPEFILAQAPVGKYRLHMGCPTGFVTVTDSKTCTLAFANLFVPGSMRGVDWPSSDRPYGCTVDYVTKIVSFNSLLNIGKQMRGRDVSICRISTRKPLAHSVNMELRCLVSSQRNFSHFKPVRYKNLCATIVKTCTAKPWLQKRAEANTDLACRLECVRHGFRCIEAKFFPVHDSCFIKLSSCSVRIERPPHQ